MDRENGLSLLPQFNMGSAKYSLSLNREGTLIKLARSADTGELLSVTSVSRSQLVDLFQSGRHCSAPVRDVLVDCDQDAVDCLVEPGVLSGDFRQEGAHQNRVGLNFDLISRQKPDVRLMPAIAQNAETKDILMVAFSNREAIDATMKKGMATFFSRSRGAWTKGETSGDFLEIDEVRFSRHANSVLYSVVPKGEGACHTKNEDGEARPSCFYRGVENLTDLRGEENPIEKARLSFV